MNDDLSPSPALDPFRRHIPRPRPPDEPVADGPSIMVASLPKSGTGHIKGTLARTLPTYRAGRSMGVSTFPKSIFWRVMLADFQRGGMIAVAHYQGDKANLRQLRSFGITKAVLHTRDPRACLWSWSHHYRQRADKFIPDPAVRESFLRQSDVEQLEFHIEHYFQDALDWLGEWDAAIRNQTIDVLLTSFEDFADNESLFRSILDFYGIEAEVVPAPPGSRFRSGSSTEWREQMPAHTVDRITAMIPDALWRRFGWQP